jgi:hypothetical protein
MRTGISAKRYMRPAPPARQRRRGPFVRPSSHRIFALPSAAIQRAQTNSKVRMVRYGGFAPKTKTVFFNKTRNARAKLSVIWNAISASSLLPRVTTFRTSHEFFGLIVEGSPAGQPDEPFFPSPQVFGLGSGATAQAPTPRVTIFIFVAIFVGLILPVVT